MTVLSPTTMKNGPNEFEAGQVDAIGSARFRTMIDSLSGLSISTQAASYTLVLADVGTCIIMNLNSDGTLTIPTNAAVPFDIGARVAVRNGGSGRVNFVPAPGVLINTAGSWTMMTNDRVWFLHKAGTDVWELYGNEPKLLIADYCLTTTDQGGAAGSGNGIVPLYGNESLGVTVAAYSRIVTTPAGGDGPTGAAYRRLTVQSGDSMGSSGVRCQIGANEWRHGWGYNIGIAPGPTTNNGTFMIFREGDHKIVEFDFRLVTGWNIAASAFQNIIQLKQAQPTNLGSAGAPSQSPIIEFSQYQSNWFFGGDPGGGTVFPFSTATVSGDVNVWHHCKLDVYFTQASVGFKQMQLTNLGGTGGFVLTPKINGLTLEAEIANNAGPNTVPIGTTVPGIMMIGAYMNVTNGSSNSVDLANIEVWDAS